MDPTHSEAVLRRSIRKYFIDTLVTVDKLVLDFDFSYTEPPGDTWVVIKSGGLYLDTLAKMDLVIYIFAKNDLSGEKLAVLRDTVYNRLVDDSANDGRARIALYNASWVIIGYAVITFVGRESEKGKGESGSFYKWIQVRLNWGAK